MTANVIKGFENIFIKLLARKKKVCIFALGLKNLYTEEINTRF